MWKVIELSRNYLDRDVERKTETWRERQRKTDGIMRKFLIYGGDVTKIRDFKKVKFSRSTFVWQVIELTRNYSHLSYYEGIADMWRLYNEKHRNLQHIKITYIGFGTEINKLGLDLRSMAC